MPHSISPPGSATRNDDEAMPDAPAEGNGVKLEDMFDDDDDEEFPASSAPVQDLKMESSPAPIPDPYVEWIRGDDMLFPRLPFHGTGYKLQAHQAWIQMSCSPFTNVFSLSDTFFSGSIMGSCPPETSVTASLL